MSIFENVVYPLRVDGVRDRGLLEETTERAARLGALDEVKDASAGAPWASPGASSSASASRAPSPATRGAADGRALLRLDPIATTKIEELISELRGRYTIIIVTHNMQQAARVSDNTGFMYSAGWSSTARPSASSRAEAAAHQDYVTGASGSGGRRAC